MKAMLLAAGLGTRLRPITDSIPKALIPVFGVPVIEHNLRWLAENGIKEVIVNLHHHPKKIMDALRDGGKWGIKLHYSLEPEILGTAGGIKKAESFFDKGPFLVVNSDTMRQVNIEELFLYHRNKKALATLVLNGNPRLAPDKAIWIDRKGQIVRFLDRFDGGRRWAKKANFIGIHLLEKDFLSYIPRGIFYEINAQVYPKVLARGEPIYGFLHKGPWYDIGTPRALRDIHFSILKGSFSLRLDVREIQKGVWIGSRVRFSRNIRLKPPLFIGPETLIEDWAEIGPYTVIGRGCRIGPGANLIRTIVFNGVKIKEGEAHRGHIVGKDFCI